MHVLRIYHGGRDHAHRARERALSASGVDLTLAVPAIWAGAGQDTTIPPEDFEVVELPVRRRGDVNRYEYDEAELRGLIGRVRPALLDVHEEPFSVASHQCLRVAPDDLPITMYTAQNVDKRYPPPFAQFERSAYRRVDALYPCSTQAASVARGKGFTGLIKVLPLGCDGSTFVPGSQSLRDDEILLGFFGRLVPEKGVTDAIRVLARLNALRPIRLVIVGSGPEKAHALNLAVALGLSDRVDVVSWLDGEELASMYRRCHVVLVPSKPTTTWVEQFGRVILEAQSSGAVVAGYASGAISEVTGGAAVLADVGDVDNLADRTAVLLRSPDDFARRRDVGLQLSRERSWERVASQQLRLYEHVVAGGARRLRLPPSPMARRRAARAEFGPPAATLAGDRPFALPLLRRGGALAFVLARALDAEAELVARLKS